MNDEQLSALLDDELPSEATRAAVSEVLADTEARSTWGRYHLIGDALRASADIRAGTVQTLPRADNILPFPAPDTAAPAPRKSLSRTGLGLAAAAALAAIAVVLTPPTPPQTGATEVAVLQPPIVAPEPTPTVINEPTLVSDDDSAAAFATTSVSQTDMVKEDEAKKRMNVYLINFNEQRARQRAPGAHPYVHIVGYDTP